MDMNYLEYPGLKCDGNEIIITDICVNNLKNIYCVYAPFILPTISPTYNPEEKCKCGGNIYGNWTTMFENFRSDGKLYLNSDEILRVLDGKVSGNMADLTVEYSNFGAKNTNFNVSAVTKTGHYLSVYTKYQCKFTEYCRKLSSVHCQFCGQIGCTFHIDYVDRLFQRFLFYKIWLIAQLFCFDIVKIIGGTIQLLHDY